MMKKLKRKPTIFIILGVVLAVFLGVFYYYQNRLSETLNINEDTMYLSVVEGDSLPMILDHLEAESVISNAMVGKVYARINRLQEVYVGEYRLDETWTLIDLIEILNSPAPSDDVVVQLTEGYWAKDMAEVLEEALGIGASDFLDAWNDWDYIQTLSLDYDFLNEDIYSESVRVLMEGYLYPDTYYIPKDATVDDITRQILDNTQSNLNEVMDLVDASGLNLHEVMIMSSVVMYEASTDYDQSMVAGVFYNRLDSDMLLQSSVTVCYALYEFENWEDCELYANQAIDSPYNTYVYAGLPVGPILNPNVNAIKNTLQYTKHDYYYFVADVYEGGDGTVYYSKTYREHENKVNELRNR